MRFILVLTLLGCFYAVCAAAPKKHRKDVDYKVSVPGTLIGSNPGPWPPNMIQDPYFKNWDSRRRNRRHYWDDDFSDVYDGYWDRDYFGRNYWDDYDYDNWGWNQGWGWEYPRHWRRNHWWGRDRHGSREAGSGEHRGRR